MRKCKYYKLGDKYANRWNEMKLNVILDKCPSCGQAIDWSEE